MGEIQCRSGLSMYDAYVTLFSMKTEPKERIITIRKLDMSDPEAQFDQPMQGTPGERLGIMWELIRMGISIGGGDDRQRLQRHVTRLISRGC